MSALAISLRDVVWSVNGRTVLDIASLEVRTGERIALVGPNGAGKSTLLRILAGEIVPSHGAVTILNRQPAQGMSRSQRRARRREVGQVFQGLHLVARLTAMDNTLIGALGRVEGWRSWLRLYPDTVRQQACEALRSVGLLGHMNMRADRLSGGERQKVAIARLLMQRPRLILADEPTAALDPAAAGDVCRLLLKAAEDATLLTVVHNTTLLTQLADRVIGLRAGRIAFDLPVDEVDDRALLALYHVDNRRPSERLGVVLPDTMCVNTQEQL